MEKPCLVDEAEYPDDRLLVRHLGDAQPAWRRFGEFIDNECPGYRREWRYYKDGNAWLQKITKKAKTICWVSVYAGRFKTTFYFPDRAEDLIVNGTLRRKTVDEFVHGRHYGKTRALVVDVRKPADLATTKKLIAIKEKVK